jgi:hypothetical protein
MKTAMVKTPPPQPRQQQQQPRQQPRQQQQQQQQPAGQQKRKKVAFKAQAITLTGPSAELAVLVVKAITLADPSAKSVLDHLCDDEWESESAYTSAQSDELPEFESTDDSRVVSVKRQEPSSIIKAWHIGSKELDLDTWTLANKNKRRSVKDRLEEPNTYASKLKGPAPGPSAQPLEPLKFLKKRNNNIVRR